MTYVGVDIAEGKDHSAMTFMKRRPDGGWNVEKMVRTGQGAESDFWFWIEYYGLLDCPDFVLIEEKRGGE